MAIDGAKFFGDLSQSNTIPPQLMGGDPETNNIYRFAATLLTNLIATATNKADAALSAAGALSLSLEALEQVVESITGAPVSSDGITSIDFFIGVRGNGDDVQYLKFTPLQMIEYLVANSKKTIVIDGADLSDGDFTLSDAFFSFPISKIITYNQVFVAGVDFTQDMELATITMQQMQLSNGQTLIAEQI